MAYAPRMCISDAKRIEIVAFSLSVVGRGRGVLARIGFFNILGRWELEVFFLYLFLLFLSWHKKRRQKKVKPPQGACFLFVVGRGRCVLAGMGFFYLLGRSKLEVFRCRYFHITGDGRINMSACYFLIELWGRMQYAPTLTHEKGAYFLSAVGRGRGDLARTGFFYL